MEFTNLITTPLREISMLSKGTIFFICTCGRKGSCKIRDFNAHTRCASCLSIENSKVLEISRKEIEELFDIFYKHFTVPYYEGNANEF
jgi:hypothetical protein